MNADSQRIDLEIKRILYRSIPLNTHTETCRASDSLVFYVKGGHRFDFGNQKIIAREGNMMYLPFASAYKNYVLTADTEYYQIDFLSYDKGIPMALFDHPCCFNEKEALQYLSLFRKIYEDYALHNTAYSFFCFSNLYKILGMLYQTEEHSGKHGCHVKKIEKAINFLNEFYYLDISIEKLAAMSCMTVSNLEKTFKKHIGCSPSAYKHMIRTEKAKLFLSGGYSLAETAEKVGYSDIYYFSKMFRKICGMPPGKYARDNRII